MTLTVAPASAVTTPPTSACWVTFTWQPVLVTLPATSSTLIGPARMFGIPVGRTFAGTVANGGSKTTEAMPVTGAV